MKRVVDFCVGTGAKQVFRCFGHFSVEKPVKINDSVYFWLKSYGYLCNFYIIKVFYFKTSISGPNGLPVRLITISVCTSCLFYLMYWYVKGYYCTSAM